MNKKDTNALKELIYKLLSSDVTLRNLLGGATDKIRHENYMQVSEYPCVVYSIRYEDANAFKGDRVTGIFKTYLTISIFSSSTSSQECDDITDRISNIMNGQEVSDCKIKVFYAREIGRRSLPEPQIKVWRKELTYELANVTK